MNKKKLLRLAEILRIKAAEWGKNESKYFDMDIWGYTLQDESCGFAGCAIGTLCHYYPNETNLKLSGNTAFSPYLVVEDENKLSYYDAIAYEFDLSKSDSSYLFDPGSYTEMNVTPEMVAIQIEQFVAEIEEKIEMC